MVKDLILSFDLIEKYEAIYLIVWMNEIFSGIQFTLSDIDIIWRKKNSQKSCFVWALLPYIMFIKWMAQTEQLLYFEKMFFQPTYDMTVRHMTHCLIYDYCLGIRFNVRALSCVCK